MKGARRGITWSQGRMCRFAWVGPPRRAWLAASGTMSPCGTHTSARGRLPLPRPGTVRHHGTEDHHRGRREHPLDAAPAGRLRQHAEPPRRSVALTDVDEPSLGPMLAIAKHIAATARHRDARSPPPPTWPPPSTAPTFVITALSVGGLPAWPTTSRSPPATGSGSRSATRVGPGGIARSLRSIPVMLDIAREVERSAPDATAPQRQQPADGAVPRRHVADQVRTVGLCNELVGLQFWLSLVFDTDMRAIDPVVAGVNHLPLVTSLRIGDEDGFAMLARRPRPSRAARGPAGLDGAAGRFALAQDRSRRGTGPRPTSWPTTGSSSRSSAASASCPARPTPTWPSSSPGSSPPPPTRAGRGASTTTASPATARTRPTTTSRRPSSRPAVTCPAGRRASWWPR